MNHAVCWITDYYAPECWERACIGSSSPTLPCTARNVDKEASRVDRH